MQIRAIALPRGAELLWIRVGKYLDPMLGHRPDETVESIRPERTGYKVETVCQPDGKGWSYLVDRLFVSRMETASGEVDPRRLM